MLIIRTAADVARALGTPQMDPALMRLLILRRDQLLAGTDTDLSGVAHFLIVEPGDTLTDVDAAAGFQLTGDEAPFEWVRRHPGGWLEAPIVLDDDGFALVLLVPDAPGTDSDLLAALKAHA